MNQLDMKANIQTHLQDINQYMVTGVRWGPSEPSTKDTLTLCEQNLDQERRALKRVEENLKRVEENAKKAHENYVTLAVAFQRCLIWVQETEDKYRDTELPCTFSLPMTLNSEYPVAEQQSQQGLFQGVKQFPQGHDEPLDSSQWLAYLRHDYNLHTLKWYGLEQRGTMKKE